MLCYVLFCYVMFCFVMLCFVLFCFVLFCFVFTFVLFFYIFFVIHSAINPYCLLMSFSSEVCTREREWMGIINVQQCCYLRQDRTFEVFIFLLPTPLPLFPLTLCFHLFFYISDMHTKMDVHGMRPHVHVQREEATSTA